MSSFYPKTIPPALQLHCLAQVLTIGTSTDCQKSLCLKITTKHETRDGGLAVFKIADFFLSLIAYRLLPVFI
jgi:hypothetical protein